MRSALAGLRASPDFSFDNFGLRPKSSSRFGHGKTSALDVIWFWEKYMTKSSSELILTTHYSQ
jgi:hypothetical protein